MTKLYSQSAQNKAEVSHNTPLKQRSGLGNIHLPTADLPHEGSKIEWWYLNGHVQDQNEREFSFFVSFFKLAIGRDSQSHKMQFAYSVTWAISDVADKRYIRDAVLDQCAPAVGLETLKKEKFTSDKRMQYAIQEVMEKNQVPAPDRLATFPARVNWEKLDLDMEGNTLRVDDDGSYALHLEKKDEHIFLDLRFKPLIQPVKHGNDGVVVGTSGEDMYYYFIPQNEVHGALMLGENKHNLTGSGWYDHEFAVETDEKEEVEVNLLHDIGWNWISLQINNACQVTAYDLFERNEEKTNAGSWSVMIGADGSAEYPEKFSLEAIDFWTSTKTFINYPVKWRFQIPEKELDLVVEAVFPEQEFISLLSEPAFWEGRVHARGTIASKKVDANGYVEVSGTATLDTMESFLKSVTKSTFKAVRTLLPLDPTDEQFINMVASTKNHHFLQGLSKEQFVQQVVKPIREIIDRGGKSWRSYAALACIDIVGGNSQPFVNWLAWPELLHTGSLIIDDIQDESLIRRGGPSCHAQHGIATAINAGNAAYFLGQPLLLDDSIPPAKKLRIYEVYFETMRAAHTGQAMDISSFYPLMDDVVASGDPEDLESKVLSVHRLKSAVPAAMLARIGAIMGDADPKTEDKLADFFEALGLAFQIMDDVLNLKGFERGLKDKGEDIRAGKITMPVVASMGLLPEEERRLLWEGVKAKPDSHEKIGELIGIMHHCGAIQACEDRAGELVEVAWNALQSHIQPSLTSVRVRAFSWFVLNRHY